MNDIKPRWEWRTFGLGFGTAEARLAALEPKGVQETDEVYLLASGGVEASDGGFVVLASLLRFPERGDDLYLPPVFTA